MKSNICIPKAQMDIITRDILTSNNSSKTRLEKFQNLLGSDIGSQLATKFEKTLLNKKATDGLTPFIERFSKKFTQLSKEEIQQKAQKIADRLAIREGNLTKDDLFAITKEFVDKKYKTDINIKDVENISKYKQQANQLKEVAFNTPQGSPERLAYGRAMSDYKYAIKQAADIEGKLNFSETLKSRAKESADNIKAQEGIGGKVWQSVKEATNLFTSAAAKGFQASADVSYLNRQGRRLLIKDPVLWLKNASESFKGIAKTMKQGMSEEALRDVRREFEAQIFSSDVYELAMKHKLAVTGITEDYFVDSIAEKAGFLGKIIGASDNAFSQFSQLTRIKMFENQVKQLTKSGPVSDKVLDAAADYVNSLTGRGSLGGAEKYSSALNRVFYSTRYMKSNYDYLTKWLSEPNLQIRRQYQKDIVRDLAVMTTGLLTLQNVFGMEVEFDPRSGRFAHVKVGDKWTDTTAGLGAYITLAARSIAGMGVNPEEAVKNNNGKFTPLNTDKYGGRNVLDLGVDFASGKAAPSLNILIQAARGRGYQGEKVGVKDIPLKYGATFLPLTGKKTFMDIYTDPEKAVESIGYGLLEATGLSVKK